MVAMEWEVEEMIDSKAGVVAGVFPVGKRRK